MYIPNNLPLDYVVPYVYINNKYNKSIITVTELLNDMNLKNTTTNRRWLNNIIQLMIDNKWINALKIKNSKYELYERYKLSPKSFKSYSFKDINTLMHIDGYDTVALVKYYIILVRTINYKTRVGCHSLNSLSEESGYNVLTLIKYNKLLEDNHIIYYVRFKNKMICNRYGLYGDRDLIDIEANKIKMRLTMENSCDKV